MVEHEGRFDQAHDSGCIGWMADISLDRTHVAEMLLVCFALKHLAQGVKFNRVADGCACAVRFDITNGLDGNLRVRLGNGDDFSLAFHAGRDK